MEHQSDIPGQARHFAEQQKEVGSEQISGVASAIHGAARELEGQMPQVASYVHDAAARLEDAAAKLHERNFDELAKSVSSFARSRPMVFFGGAVLTGLAISRFLKSSSSGSDQRPRT